MKDITCTYILFSNSYNHVLVCNNLYCSSNNWETDMEIHFSSLFLVRILYFLQKYMHCKQKYT